MKFGYFSDKTKEYVIERPDTPTPWINYLNNGKYCAMVSNTGGGYSFYIDPRDQRILRYRYNNIPVDRPGRYLYLKNLENNKIWSPTWQPMRSDLGDYKCYHGLGYTRIEAKYDDIQTEVRYFVPPNHDLEIWSLKIKNNSNIYKKLKIFSFAEFCLWNAVKDQRDLQYIQNVAVAKYDHNLNTIFYRLFDQTSPIAFFTTDTKIDGFDCDREVFIGPYRSEECPICVEKGKCSNSQALGGNPIAATESAISLAPGKERKINYILGVVRTKTEASPLINLYSNHNTIPSEYHLLKETWHNFLAKFQVRTPNHNFNSLINIWNPYQCKTTFDWARYASFYETGIGRGIGFRDSHQDTLAVCHVLPNEVRQRILNLATIQFENGSVFHNYFPLTKTGDFPDYLNPRMKFFSDDHLWMIFAVSNYLKETGDFSILEEEISYVSGLEESLYNHLKRALEFTENHLGPHGFPLIGTADWNDSLQLHGPNQQGESVMVAMQYHKALLDMIEIAQEIGISQDQQIFRTRALKMNDTINENGWDGKWYIRAYDDNGSVVGSHTNTEGKIFLNTQSWAIISGVASQERGLMCMNSIREYLNSKHGLKLFDPPYTKYYNELKGISAFPPGLKENAAIFCHTNPWAEIAECILGRGDRAYEYFEKIAPTTKNPMAEIHKTEPYVYAQMITGEDHPNYGSAKNSWLTGTASWTLKAATDWILGIRPDFHGLLIDPCIPSAWKEFSVTRYFRGAIYNIKVTNPSHVFRGVQSIKIDGKNHPQLPLPIFPPRESHNIQILMG